MNYYDKFAQDFIYSTLNLELSHLYKPFLKEICAAGKILDIGCGPGRDLKYFKDQGHEVCGIEPSHKLAKFAREYSGCVVHEDFLQNINLAKEKYDGIWACASLLHIAQSELSFVFTKVLKHMNNGAVMYCSFKLGEFEGERNGRFFNDQTPETIKKYIPRQFVIIKSWITNDQRPDREEKWLNLLLKFNKR